MNAAGVPVSSARSSEMQMSATMSSQADAATTSCPVALLSAFARRSTSSATVVADGTMHTATAMASVPRRPKARPTAQATGSGNTAEERSATPTPRRPTCRSVGSCTCSPASTMDSSRPSSPSSISALRVKRKAA